MKAGSNLINRVGKDREVVSMGLADWLLGGGWDPGKLHVQILYLSLSQLHLHEATWSCANYRVCACTMAQLNTEQGGIDNLHIG